MKRWLLLVLALGIFAQGASAASWYVHSAAACTFNGDGTATGCAASGGAAGAWRTIANVGWSSIHAGDTLFLEGGDTYAGEAMTIGALGSEGSPGNPITISVTGAGSATMDGLAGWNFNGHSYITVDGLRGSAAFGGSQSYGIRVTNIIADAYCGYVNNGETNIIIKHVECYSTAATGTDDNRGGFFITSAGGGFEVAYNWIHGPAPGSGSATCFSISNPLLKWCATALRLYSGIGGTSLTSGGIVHDNRVDQLFNDGLSCGGNCSIYHNDISNVDHSGHSDSILFQSCSYDAAYDNYIHNSLDQNIYLDNLNNTVAGPVYIYNNIINSNPGFGIVLDAEGGASSSWDDVEIISNTFFDTSASSIRQVNRGGAAQATNLVILNNIFGTNTDNGYRNVDLLSTSTITVWDYDVYSTASANYPNIASYTAANQTLAQLQALSPAREAHGSVGIPSYVNAVANADWTSANFRLTVNDTVALGKGSNLTSSFPYAISDFSGFTRPASGNWDLGAYEQFGASGIKPGTVLHPGVKVH